MKLNQFQSILINEKLKANNWVTTPDGQPSKHLSLTYTNHKYWSGDQDITIYNQELSLGRTHYDLYTWGQLLDFIELKIKIVYQSPMTYLSKK